MDIGIIGIGMVGKSLRKWFGGYNYSLLLYDKIKGIGSIEEVNKANIIFICVPTPFDEDNINSNLIVLEDVLSKINGGKIIVIKSTILPGTINYFQNKYPDQDFLHNPEFLTEATAEYDTFNPDIQVVGYTSKSYFTASIILSMLPKAPIMKIVKAKESEFLKYFCNIFFSTKVIFVNQMYDVCDKLEINYNNIKELASYSKMIAPSHLEVWHKNKRGYNGKCLPKDIKTFIRFVDGLKVNTNLFKVVDKINDKLLKDGER